MRVLREVEQRPDRYSFDVESQDGRGMNSIAAWQRIEAWVSERWTPRSVVWVVEGSGSWEPRLRPAVIETTEVWLDGGWTPVTLEATPLGGLCLPGEGPYRVTANVGADNPLPAAVLEAALRLAAYPTDAAPVTSFRSGEVAQIVVASEVAKAIHMSGAADLLRPYRHLGGA